MNTPDPPHWTVSSCFGVFHSVWVHLGSFRNWLKLGPKRGELEQVMQKFVPRSHVGIFLQRTHPIHPIRSKTNVSVLFVVFGCIWDRFISAWNLVLNILTGSINTKVRARKSRCNFSQRTHLIHPIGPKPHVLVCFIVIVCIWNRFVTARNSVQNGVTWSN